MENKPDSTPAAGPARVHEFGYYAPMEDMSLDIRRYVMERLK